MTAQIIIAGWIEYEPTDRADVLKHFTEVARVSRKEAGCVDYSVTSDSDDDKRIRVFEHWVSDAALESHLKTPHVSAFKSAIADRPRRGRLLFKHVIDSSAPMRSSSSS